MTLDKYMISLVDTGALTESSKSANITGMVPLELGIILEHPWSPMIYSGNRRLERDFVYTALLVLDIDNDGTRGMTLNESLERFREYKHIIGTSRSHQKIKTTKAGKQKPAQDRYRVILFLENEVRDKATYQATFEAALEELDLIGIADPLKDLARFFYPCEDIISERVDGRLIPVHAGTLTVVTKAKSPEVLSPGQKGKLTPKTLAFLAGEETDENWHSRFVAAAFDLKSQGYSFEDAQERLKRASPTFTLDAVHDLPQLRDIYEKRDPYRVKTPHWPVTLTVKGGGVIPDPTAIQNVEYLIGKLLGYDLYMDTRRGSVRKAGTNELFTDLDHNIILREAYIHKVLRDSSAINAAITNMANLNRRDLLKEAIEAETYVEGVDEDYIERLFTETIAFQGADIDEDRGALYRLMLRRWLVGIVTKIYNPGEENNVIVFVGQQGKGKSRWLKKLASIWHEGYKEGHIDPSLKDHEVAHLHYFLWHVAELDSTTNSKDVGALKDFFTKSTVKVRKAYDKYETEGDSICSFCASVNSTDFLHDTSGNRRYLVIPIQSLNPDHNIPIAKVFAQAKYLMDSGYRQWFNAEEIAQINENAERYRFKDAVLELLEERLEPGDDPMSVNEIMRALSEADPNSGGKPTKALTISVSNYLYNKQIPKVNHSGIKKYKVNKAKMLGRTQHFNPLLKKVVDNGVE